MYELVPHFKNDGTLLSVQEVPEYTFYRNGQNLDTYTVIVVSVEEEVEVVVVVDDGDENDDIVVEDVLYNFNYIFPFFMILVLWEIKR